ncbi:MAG: response regulator [Caulobacteraceae bacterium]
MTWPVHPESGEALRGRMVLVVEDEPIVALELEAILADEGATVVGPVNDLAEGLRLAEAAGISAALLDVRLGRQTVAPLARALEMRGIPFIFYTGQGEADDVRREWPAALFIAKPAPARSLVAAVQALEPHLPQA